MTKPKKKKIENSDWFRSIYLYKYGPPARSFASQPFEVLSLLITQRGNGGVKEIREDGEANNGQEQEEEQQKGSWLWVRIRVAWGEGEEAPNTDTGWKEMQPPGSAFI